MILKLGVELMKRALPQLVIALHKKGTERALRQWPLVTLLVHEHAEFHIDVGELREGIVVAVERGTTEREEALLLFRKDVRLHSPNLVQTDPPLFQRRIVEKGGQLLIVDCLNFRDNKRRNFANRRE